MKLKIIITILLVNIGTNLQAKESIFDSYLRKSGAVIIGDTGFDPESTAYVKNIIEEYVNSKGCLKVALEITSDQQKKLNQSLGQGENFKLLKLNNYVDRDSYYDLLQGLSKQIKEEKCLKVYAIDKPESAPVDRDAWMANQVEKLVSTEPVLVLSGNLQAIKKIIWKDGEIRTRFLAERIRRKEIKTVSIMQYWTSGECEERRVSKMIFSQGPRATSYVNDILGSVGAELTQRPSEVTDAIILWKCLGDTGTVVDNTTRADIEIPTAPVNITDTIKETELTLDDIKIEGLRKDIKNERLKVGMSKDHVLLSKGKPVKALKRVDLGENVEEWIYECADDWGFYYECIIVTFNGNQVIKIFDIE